MDPDHPETLGLDSEGRDLDSKGDVLQMALGKMAHGRNQCWQSLDAEAQMPR